MTTDLDMLVACFRAYFAYRDTLPEGTVLNDSPWNVFEREQAATAVEFLLEHPVREALKGKVRDVGWRIAVAGDLTNMRAMCERVKAAFPDRSEWVGDLMEMWWHGIGTPERGIWLV